MSVDDIRRRAWRMANLPAKHKRSRAPARVCVPKIDPTPARPFLVRLFRLLRGDKP